jgi:hypothetical protein
VAEDEGRDRCVVQLLLVALSPRTRDEEDTAEPVYMINIRSSCWLRCRRELEMSKIEMRKILPSLYIYDVHM